MKGKELRTIRDKLGWTQVEMAKALEVTANTVARWERNERSISAPIAKLIQTVMLQKGEKAI